MNQDLPSLLNAFSGLQVLLVGDVMIDRYIYGAVSRISPEAPVPIVSVQKSEDRLGGAANVALNLKALGAIPWLCSLTGEDENADRFSGLLPAAGLSDKGIIRSPGRPTTVKTRIVAQNQHLIRLDEESIQPASEQEQQQLETVINRTLRERKIDVILIQDYNKGVMTISMIRFLTAASLRLGIPICIDPKHQHFWEYKEAALFKPNLSEVSRALGYSVAPTLPALRTAARKLRESINAATILITLSDKGAFVDHLSESLLVPTEPRQIADVSGAGDSVFSIVSLAMILGVRPRNIAILANLAGGQVCEQFGVVPIDKQRLMKESSGKWAT